MNRFGSRYGFFDINEQYRRNVFVKNYFEIVDHNRKSGTTFKMRVNQFTGLTQEEFEEYALGQKEEDGSDSTFEGQTIPTTNPPDGNGVINNGSPPPSPDPNCEIWNSSLSRCSRCKTGYTVNKTGRCEKVNDTQKDPNCQDFNWNTRRCIRCRTGYTVNTKTGGCDKVNVGEKDPNCQDYNWDTRRCRRCFQGYDLSGKGTCFRKDPNCRNMDWDNGICLQCSHRFYFNSQRICTPVDPRCRDHDERGRCTSCYPGDVVRDGRCVLRGTGNGNPDGSPVGSGNPDALTNNRLLMPFNFVDWDWRGVKGAITPPKDQKNCGSCYAFAATAAVESAIIISKGYWTPDLSEQQIVDCTGHLGNLGCRGGYKDRSMWYAETNGLVSESAYPYTARKGWCKYNKGTYRIKSV